MARKNRFARPDTGCISPSGNDKQRIFLSDADRRPFLHLLETRSEQRAVRVSAYALMSNHFHLVATSDRPDAVSLFMMDLNGLYATHRNVTHHHTGRVWQGRFYSCVLDDAHWETALRYVEMNPVRAQRTGPPPVVQYRTNSLPTMTQEPPDTSPDREKPRNN